MKSRTRKARRGGGDLGADGKYADMMVEANTLFAAIKNVSSSADKRKPLQELFGVILKSKHFTVHPGVRGAIDEKLDEAERLFPDLKEKIAEVRASLPVMPAAAAGRRKTRRRRYSRK